MNFEERVEIMSHNDPEQTRNKWEKTGLLIDLDDETAIKISQLCENQVRHLQFTHSTDEKNINLYQLDFLYRNSFQLIRRIFGDPKELTFTFESSVVPAFLYTKEGEKEERGRAMTIHYYDYESYFTKKEIEELDNEPFYYNFCRDAEKVLQLSERFKNELNEKYAGKHLIFGYPFVIKETEEGEEKIVYRCAVVDGGSRLVAGQFRREENENH